MDAQLTTKNNRTEEEQKRESEKEEKKVEIRMRKKIERVLDYSFHTSTMIEISFNRLYRLFL